MRWSIVILFVAVFGTTALAKPKLAVAPLEGDTDDKVAEVIVELLGDAGRVIGPQDVAKVIEKLGIAGALDAKDVQRVQAKLKAKVVVYGRVKKGKKRALNIVVVVRGKKPSEISMAFKSPGAESFRTDLRKQLAKRIEGIGDTDDPEDADEDEERKKAEAEKEKKREEERAEKEKEERAEKAKAEKAEKAEKDEKRDRKKRASSDDDDDDDGKRRRKKRRDADDEEEPSDKRPRLGPALIVDAGGAVTLRRLTYDSSSSLRPPTVSTGAPSARVNVEVYPFAFGGKAKGIKAAFGFAADYDRSIGLVIKEPTTMKEVSIAQGHYSIGARYRIAVGTSSILTLGVSYTRRSYTANRSGLPTPTTLDMPDVDYTAAAPGFTLRSPYTESITLYGRLEALLVLDAGAIITKDHFGPATAYGGMLSVGADYAMTDDIALRAALDYSQVNLSFKGTDSPTTRGVSSTTDRMVGAGASLVVTY